MEKMNSKKLLNRLDNVLKKDNISVDEELARLNNHPLLKDYTVTVSNYNKLALYVEACENCKNCKGLANCKNNAIGCSLKLSKGAEYTVEAYPCKYKLEDDAIKEKKSRFKTLYLSEEMLNASFDSFRIDTTERQKAYQFAMNFATSYAPKTSTKGLYVCGNFQIGKTYFLAATANLLAEHNIESLLIYFPDLVRELKSAMNDRDKEKFENKINMIKTVPVLMLDDLGAEMASPWLRDEILCPILNYRLMEHLPVFFSSNLPLNEQNEHYKNIDNDFNNSRRIVERIKALSMFIEFQGK